MRRVSVQRGGSQDHGSAPQPAETLDMTTASPTVRSFVACAALVGTWAFLATGSTIGFMAGLVMTRAAYTGGGDLSRCVEPSPQSP